MSEHPNPLHRIREICELQHKLERDLVQAIDDARAEGRTWGQIGLSMYGLTRAGARQWFVRHKQRADRPRDTSE